MDIKLNIKNNNVSSYDWCAYALILMSVIPNTTYGLMFRVVVILICVLMMSYHGRFIRVNRRGMLLVGLMFLSSATSMIFGMLFYSTPNITIIGHELLRLMVNVLCIVVAIHIVTVYDVIYKGTLILFVYVFFIQLMQWISPYVTNDFIRRLYVGPGQDAKHLVLATYRNFGINGFRAGSIYINANICGQVLICCMIVFLSAYYIKRKKMALGFIALDFFGVLLTGSRTALLLFFIIIAIYLFFDRSQSGIIRMVVLGTAGVTGVAYLINTGNKFVSRGLNFDVTNNSLVEKFKIYIDYFEQASPAEVIFGGLGNPTYFQLDAEWGYVVSYYGLFGLVWYFALIYLVVKKRKRDGLVRWSYPLFLVLCAMTATVFFNLQISTLFFVLALSYYTVEPVKDRKLSFRANPQTKRFDSFSLENSED